MLLSLPAAQSALGAVAVVVSWIAGLVALTILLRWGLRRWKQRTVSGQALARPWGALASPVTALLVAAAGGIAATIALADGALESGDLSAYDPALTAWAISQRLPGLTVIARILTALGSSAVLVPAAIVLVVVLALWKRRPLLPVTVAVAMLTALTTTIALKSAVGRQRPPSIDMIGTVLSSPAFPSGHTLNSTVFFGLLAVVIVGEGRRRGWPLLRQLACAAGAAVMAVLVGLSRIYLGFHWGTDVVAGWTLGATILCLTMAGLLGAVRFGTKAPDMRNTP